MKITGYCYHLGFVFENAWSQSDQIQRLPTQKLLYKIDKFNCFSFKIFFNEGSQKFIFIFWCRRLLSDKMSAKKR